MRHFVLFKNSPRKLARITQFVDIVSGNPACPGRHRNSVFESQVCVDGPYLSAFNTGGITGRYYFPRTRGILLMPYVRRYFALKWMAHVGGIGLCTRSE